MNTIQINPADNVIVALSPLAKGTAVAVPGVGEVVAAEAGDEGRGRGPEALGPRAQRRRGMPGIGQGARQGLDDGRLVALRGRRVQSSAVAGGVADQERLGGMIACCHGHAQWQAAQQTASGYGP